MAGTETLWKGLLTGLTINNLTLTSGTDQLYPIGSIVEPMFTSSQMDAMFAGLTNQHNQLDGSHNAAAAATIAPLFTNASIGTAKLASDAGIVTGMLADTSVTPAKLQAGTGTSWVWANYNPTTQTGWATPTYNCSYIQMGKTVIFMINVTGTSNAATASISLPVAAKSKGGFSFEGWMGFAVDNGSTVANSGRMVIDPVTNANLISFYGGAAGGWTASGTKTVRGTAIYEAA